MQKNFTKSDLKTGMVVKIRSGNMYLVLRDTVFNYSNNDFDFNGDLFVNLNNRDGWMSFSQYNNNLTLNDSDVDQREFDIVKVYSTNRFGEIYELLEHPEYIIWERTEEPTDFFDDKETMEDFLSMDKKDFLDSYDYLTEEDYNLTLNKVRETLGLIF